MEFPLILTDEQVAELEYEVIPNAVKTNLTRHLRRDKQDRDSSDLYWQNDVINRARTLAEMPVYVLTPDDLGDYMSQEYAWHRGEFETCIRRLNSIQFVEFVAEAVENGWVGIGFVNSLLSKANTSIVLDRSNENHVVVDIVPTADLNTDLEQDHRPNVRTLIARLDRELAAGDYAAVLHCSAVILETVAKDVVGTAGVAEQTLGASSIATRPIRYCRIRSSTTF